MIRGIYSKSAHEVRLKLLHRTHGSSAMQGAWNTSDRFLISSTFQGHTLLLGVESDIATRRELKRSMRGDLRITVIHRGFFRDRVEEIVDFDVSVLDMVSNQSFGVFWTLASGFRSSFKDSLFQGFRFDASLSKYLHDADIMRDDGPNIVIYRNFFDDETCVRIRSSLWENLSRQLSEELRVPLIERSHIVFDGETYDLSSTVRIGRHGA